MKICLFVFDITRKGGVEKMACLIANYMANTHDVTILSVVNRAKDRFFQINSSVKVKVLSVRPGTLRNLIPASSFFRRGKYDIVINVDTGMAVLGILATKVGDIKMITWEHSNFYNEWGTSKFRYIRRFAAHNSDAYVVLTQKDKNNFERNIRRCCPIYVIPNPAPSCNVDYNCDSHIIISAGQLLPIKRFHLAIEIASKILKSEPGWKWIICGEGRERNRLEEMISNLGLENQVLLPGTICNMDEQYREAAIFVMTSAMEGLPMVLLEAKAHGIPIVSFDIMTGPSDIIDDSVNGFLVQPDDIEMMAEKILVLMRDRDMRLSFSKHAQDGLDKFDIHNIVNAWEELFSYLRSV